MSHIDDTMHAPEERLAEGTPATEQKPAEVPRKKARRGFAAMSADKQKAIASLGGKAAHAKGTAHEFSPEEAREAGRKGGQAAQRARQTPAEPETTPAEVTRWVTKATAAARMLHRRCQRAGAGQRRRDESTRHR